MEKIINLIRKEIKSYQDLKAPERMALARLITKIEYKKRTQEVQER